VDARNQLLLSAVLDFTEDDLAANRAGRLSARQAARLRKIRSWSRLAMFIVVALAIGLVMLAAFNEGQPYRGYYVGTGFRATLVSAESL
jgi:hypothetical protein